MLAFRYYKQNDKEQQSPIGKMKALPRCDHVGNRLRSIMLEDNSNHLLLRQQAGLEKRALKKRTSRAPKAYDFRQQYEINRKKEQLKIASAQRKLNEFHSHPVPNFSRMHKLWENRNKMRQSLSLLKITKTETPLTLLSSIEANKKRDLKMEQLNRELNKKVKIKSPSFDSWRKPPFIVNIQSSIIKPKPFNLISVQRGEKRKQFDEWFKREQEVRWRHMAIDWAHRCQTEYKRLRKLTNFKAQPNPSKRTKASKSN